MASDSRNVVLAALAANAGIAVLKGFAFLLTGSRSMLSETYHSISDTGNQVLLLVGLVLAGREATRRHPFGWGKAEYFYAFVVAVLLFGIAGWESLQEGLAGLKAHHVAEPQAAMVLGVSIPGFWVSIGVLAGAFVFELYALSRATRAMKAAKERLRASSLWETFRRSKDGAVLTAFTEDLLALAGLTVAGVGLTLTHVTGNPAYDAAGAVVIGVLLMGFALLLAWEHKRLILGEAMEAWQEDEIRGLLVEVPGIAEVIELRTVHFGRDQVLAVTEVRFRSDVRTEEIEAAIDAAESSIRSRFPEIDGIYVEAEGGSSAGA